MLVAVLLVQIGAVTHAAWNLIAARQSGGGRFVWVYCAWTVALLVPTVVAYAVWRDLVPTWQLVGAGMLSGCLHTGYNVFLQRAYGSHALNVAYPVARGVGPVLVVLVAVAFMGEHLGGFGVVGLVVISAGVAVISAGPRGGSGAWAGVRAGLVVAIFIASYTLWDDLSMARWRLDPFMYFACTGVLQFVGITALCVRELGGLRADARAWRRPAVAVAVLGPVSYLLVLVAMQTAPVSLVAPLRSTSIAIGSLAAWLMLKEPHGPRRLGGACLVIAGVALMTLSAS